MTEPTDNDDAPEAAQAPAPGAPEPAEEFPPVAFADLDEPIRAACERAGWKSLTPVQARTIPYLMAGRDVTVQSKTGSGKTGAFLLPLLNLVDPNRAECQAMILVPTRELAQQVVSEAHRIFPDGVRAVAVYGGVGYGPQLDAFRAGAHVVIGTPGRILDHLIRRSLTLAGLRYLVFDEADRMLSMGFYPDMRRIDGFLPRKRCGAMFSATYPDSVLRLSRQFLSSPETLCLSSDTIHATETEHCHYEVEAMDKDRALVRIIEIENPESAIVFCNRKVNVNYVTTVLQRFGYDADQLTADLGQGARDEVMSRLRAGKLRFLVATDLAGRGIDVSGLSHVFNYELPEDPESYIHRTGRTGRAGRTGVAISLVAGTEVSEIARLGRRFGIEMIRRATPTDEDVAKVVSERLVALLDQKLRDRDKLRVERMKRLEPLVRSLSESPDELALIAMVLDDYYQESLHAPPGGPDAAPPKRAPAAPAAAKSDRDWDEEGNPRPPRRRRRR